MHTERAEKGACVPTLDDIDIYIYIYTRTYIHVSESICTEYIDIVQPANKVVDSHVISCRAFAFQKIHSFLHCFKE